MKLIEQFICGKKNDPALCEDIIVVSGGFLAVIDGATTKSCPEIAGKSGGRFAAETVARAIEKLEGDIQGEDAVAALSEALHAATSAHMKIAAQMEKPACSLAVYSMARREIWRVGDVGILLGGAPHMAVKQIETVTSGARAMMIEALLAEGESLSSLQAEDKGRAFIMPLLQRQHVFANRADDAVFGYGVMNGDHIPRKYVEIIPVAGAGEVVLASDGYPDLRPTLAETEAALQDILRDDPLLYRRHPSTKGLQVGQVSFDDRSYLRFAP